MSFASRSAQLWLLLLLSVTCIFTGLERGYLPSYDDGYYAQKAREMLHAGSLMTASLEGHPRFDNPPGFFWLIMGSYKIFGENEFGARFPSALAGVLGILGTYFLFELLLGARVGFLAALILNLTTLYLKYSRHSMMDVTVAASGVWCYYFFLRGLKDGTSKGAWFFLLSGLIGSYIMFAKSAFGVVALGVLFFYLLIAGEFRAFLRPALWAGLLLFIFPYAGWCFYSKAHHGDTFVEKHFYALLVGKASHRGDNDFWYDYFIVLGKYFPIFLPFMGYGIYRAVVARSDEAAPNRFALVYFLTYLVALSLQSTTKTWYFIPAFPACAGLAAVGMDRALRRYSFERIVRGTAYLAVTVFLILHVTQLGVAANRAVEIHSLAPYVRLAAQNNFKVVGLDIDSIGLNSSLLFYSDHSAQGVDEKGLEDVLASGSKVALMVDPPRWAKSADKFKNLTLVKSTPKFLFLTNAPLPMEETF